MVMSTRPVPSSLDPVTDGFIGKIGKWASWFAWHPVTTISNRRVWLKQIYRRDKVMYNKPTFSWIKTVEYGDVFDLMKL